MFSVIVLIAIIYAASRPGFVHFSGVDEALLSRSHTASLNTFFIFLVMFRHAMMAYHYPVPRWLELEFMLNWRGVGQLLVTTFLFFSGYGIMYSLMLKGKKYLSGFVKHRMAPLYMRYWVLVAVCGLLSHFLAGKSYSIGKIISAFLAYDTIGNQDWYVFITLSLYVILYAVFYFSRLRRMTLALTGVTCLLVVLLGLLYYVGGKVGGWLDTALCFPAGMFFCLYRRSLGQYLLRCPIPTIVIALFLLLAGICIYRFGSFYRCNWGFLSYLVNNAGGVVFATGVALMMCCITLQRIQPFLIWCGGPALFYLYMAENIIIIIALRMDWLKLHPVCYLLTVIIGTLLLALVLIPLFKWMDNILGLRSKSVP